MNLEERILKARGEGDVDLLLTNCRLVNVLSGTIESTSVAVASGTVVGLGGEYQAEQVIDLDGRYLAPGLIDAHVHIESSMVTVPQFAAAVVPRGTTTVFTDCHEISNVMGLDGIRYMIESSAGTPLDVFVMLPSCVPATHMETSGADLEADDLAKMVDHPRVVGLGEVMNFPGTIAGDPAVLAKISIFPNGPIDGHAPGLSGEDLNAYIAAGPDSEHECTSPEEAEEKLKKGMYIFLREGTGARNLKDLLPVVNRNSVSSCCLCIDDRHPADLLERGHIDSMLEMTVDFGLDPVTAVQMATLNTARRFRFTRRGAVAVGFRADMVVFDDLEVFEASMVFKNGTLVAEKGELIVHPGEEPEAGSTFDVAGFKAERLRLPADGSTVRVIGAQDGQIVTDSLEHQARVERGEAVADPGKDLLKVAVVERHRGTGNVGVSFVKGFGLKSGALASSVAHDSHNVVVVGCNDQDMAVAVRRVVEMGGGQVVASAGNVIEELPLPIAGLMSPMPLGEVARKVELLNRAASDLGCRLSHPFMTISFLALPVIPELKLTDMGLVDVNRFDFVGPFAD